MKEYNYNPKRYFLSVTAPGFFMIGILIFSLSKNIKSTNFNIYTLAIIVSIYGIINTFVSISHPEKIVDDGEKLEFHSFGRVHSYYLNKVKYFRIKEYYNGKIYLRIGNPTPLKGRYWINAPMYTDGEELYLSFREREKKIHPDSLKYRESISPKRKNK